MDLVVIDLETTGVNPEVDRVVELAWCCSKWPSTRNDCWVVDPGRSIPPEASAVHHIRDCDVQGAPNLEYVLEQLPTADAYVAHNSRFDSAFLPPPFCGPISPDDFPEGWDAAPVPAVPWIDTYRAALWTWPEAPGHSNQVLRYWLELDDSDLILPPDLFPHRALYDALTTAGILRALLRIHSVEQLLEWSQRPALLPRITFSKYGPGGSDCPPEHPRGMPWSEVPRGFLQWMEGKGWDAWDPDVAFTAQHYLGQ